MLPSLKGVNFILYIARPYKDFSYNVCAFIINIQLGATQVGRQLPSDNAVFATNITLVRNDIHSMSQKGWLVSFQLMLLVIFA